MASLCFAVLILSNLLVANAVQVAVLSTPQDEAPGAFVTHVFSVTNDSADPHDYTIGYTLPTGWGTVSAPARVPLGPGQESTFFVTITIAPDAASATYDVTVTAAAEDVPSDAGSAAAPVTVTPVNDFELVVPNGGRASPGGRIRYDVVVFNRGNTQDSYAIEAVSSSGLTTAISVETFDLAPQERVTIEIQLDIPAETDAGRDTLAITVVSMLYEALESEGVIFTVILPPGPESVGGMLMEQLPARIRLSLDKDVLNGDFSSRLTFSASGQVARRIQECLHVEGAYGQEDPATEDETLRLLREEIVEGGHGHLDFDGDRKTAAVEELEGVPLGHPFARLVEEAQGEVVDIARDREGRRVSVEGEVAIDAVRQARRRPAEEVEPVAVFALSKGECDHGELGRGHARAPDRLP